ncbi:MAG: MetS family NSS transporter small subunit [Methanosarcinaceae archaeon]|nr:MetS family NSS transporter small subunit [Methanosarcinaceae archaeon]MDD4331504.1 MetS family NSS transporter small subunit [Methanosarcinaceae archaeon]MDD4748385.1 MetS family NSS transporter small subunit [Methanosarcinaceae archaeon]
MLFTSSLSTGSIIMAIFGFVGLYGGLAFFLSIALRKKML